MTFGMANLSAHARVAALVCIAWALAACAADPGGSTGAGPPAAWPVAGAVAGVDVSAPAPVNRLTPAGFITDWVLIGPFRGSEPPNDSESGRTTDAFDRDFLAGSGGEAGVAWGAGEVVRYDMRPGAGRAVRSQRVGPARDDPRRPDFAHILDGRHVVEQDYDQAVGYAFCWLESERDQTVYAYLGADGAVKVFLNGAPIYESRDQRKTQPWQHRMTWRLRAGRNALLLKIENRLDWWGFQIEVYPDDRHEDGWRRAVKRLAIEDVRVDGRQIRLRAELSPRPLGVVLPVRLSARAESGETLAAVEGRSGEWLELRGAAESAGPIVLRAETADPRLPQPVSAGWLTWGGDAGAEARSLRDRLERAAARGDRHPPARRGVTEGVLTWLRDALARPAAGADWRAVRWLQFARAFIEAMETDRDFPSLHPGAALPIAFDRRAGTEEERPGRYFAFLPSGFPEPGRRYPLVIDLHGSNAGANKAPFDKYNRPGVPMDGEPILAVCPITFSRGWRPNYLNDVLADVKARFPVDEDRVYLQGGSMGGKGTWDWATAHPEHFAAIAPFCPAEGEPFRAARLARVPVWVFNGETDLASYPFMPELMLSALRRAGGVVNYSLFPDRGHSLGDAVDRRELKTWFLRHRRARASVPPDPVDGLRLDADGVSPVEVIDLPARAVLALTDREADAYPQDHLFRAAVKLFQAYRKTAGPAPDRLADGCVLLRYRTGGEDGAMTLCLDAPQPLAAPRKGDLCEVALPAWRAARVYVRGTWPDLCRKKRRVLDDLARQGTRLTGEERAVVVPLTLKKETRLWELHLALDESSE
jgi:hypothetical protein